MKQKNLKGFLGLRSNKKKPDAFKKMILAGEQSDTDNGDPYSLDIHEQQSLEEAFGLQNFAIENKIFEQLKDPEVDRDNIDPLNTLLKAPAKFVQKLRIDNVAGIVGTAGVLVKVPANCKLIRAHCLANLCVLSNSPMATFAAPTIDAAQNSMSIGYFAAGMPSWFPVRTQLDTIYIASSSADNIAQLAFYCGDDFDISDFVM